MLRTRCSPSWQVRPSARVAAGTPGALARLKPLWAFVAAAVPLLLTACTSTTAPALARPPAAPASPAAGPSVAQLAHGHWVKMAVPPIRLCQPFALWDGHVLIVVESGVAPCHPAAALFYPSANRWAKITAPPQSVGRNYFSAWGGGRLVLMSRRTGIAAAWSPGTRRWLGLPRLPATGVISLTWTGRMFLAIAARPGKAIGRAWRLAGHHWQSLPSLPPVWHGWYVGAPAAVLGGSVYVLAHEFHGKLKKHNISGSSRLLRLTGSGWTVVPLPPAIALGWTYVLIALDGRLLATGTGCPIDECMEAVGLAAIITPGAPAHAALLSPPGDLNVPFPGGFATGPHAAVVTYSAGGNTLSGGAHFRAVEIYDPQARRWLTGPRAPATPPGRSAYWTPYGVVSLGQGGGWLLRPADRGPAAAG
jgi:hypothetical protein